MVGGGKAGLGCRWGAVGAAAVEVERRVVDLEAVALRDSLAHLADIPLADLGDSAALGADEVMVVLRLASDVGVDVPRALEAPRCTHGHQRLQRAEDSRATDVRMIGADPLVELLSRQLRPRSRAGIG